MANASVILANKQLENRRSSCDTVCSTNSSCLLQKRKTIHPLAGSIRTFGSKSGGGSTVKQRVLSARLLKLRSLQSQLNDANFHLADLQQENRALKTLQKRQDKALSKYEGTNADLPRLLKSHEEEIKVLHVKNRSLRKTLKEVTDQLKLREDELTNAREQLRHLYNLSKDKNLGEREKLAEQLDELQEKFQKSEAQVGLLNRKIMLESKNYKYKLNGEILKHKQCQKDLAQSLMELERLGSIVETKQKFTPIRGKRFTNASNLKASSLTNLGDRGSDHSEQLSTDVNSDTEQLQSNSDIKLEPICNDKELKSITNGMLIPPSETIKARLSAKATKIKDVEKISSGINKMHLSETDLIGDDQISVLSTDSPPTYLKQDFQPSFSQKLQSLGENMNASFKKVQVTEKTEINIGQRLTECGKDVLASVQDCTTVVTQHKNDFQNSKTETAKLLESLRQTDVINSKLRHSLFLASDFNVPEKDADLVNQILKDELSYKEIKKSEKSSNFDYLVRTSDKNGNVIKKQSDVPQEDKRKLLATLRAIDNGEDIDDDTGNNLNRKSKLMHELFGNH